MPPMIAALLAVAAVLCILLSTLFGVSPISDWLLDASQILFLLGVILFGGYVVDGIIRDAHNL